VQKGYKSMKTIILNQRKERDEVFENSVGNF